MALYNPIGNMVKFYRLSAALCLELLQVSVFISKVFTHVSCSGLGTLNPFFLHTIYYIAIRRSLSKDITAFERSFLTYFKISEREPYGRVWRHLFCLLLGLPPSLAWPALKRRLSSSSLPEYPELVIGSRTREAKHNIRTLLLCSHWIKTQYQYNTSPSR